MNDSAINNKPRLSKSKTETGFIVKVYIVQTPILQSGKKL